MRRHMEEDTKAGEQNKSIIEQGGREAGIEGKRRGKLVGRGEGEGSK